MGRESPPHWEEVWEGAFPSQKVYAFLCENDVFSCIFALFE